MATSSPALSNTSADTTSNTGTASSAVVRPSSTIATPMVMSNSSINTSKNLRGLNKPKCIKCGNVARSRCPYQACKSCCAKAQNPCHIHVLKGNSSFPDKTPSTTSSLTHQHSNETSSSGNTHRVTSLRQLSNNFSQFNNLQTPARARKPLTRKEAYQINEWRFSKLKEYKDRNIEIENESFDRYLQNISLLEDVFALNSNSKEENETISNLKRKLQADPIRTENFRDKIRFIVNNGLKNLETETEAETETLETGSKKARFSGLVELNKKLTSARTDEDLKLCRVLKSQLFNRLEKNEKLEPEPEPERVLGKWFSVVTIDPEVIGQIDARFNDIEAIEQL